MRRYTLFLLLLVAAIQLSAQQSMYLWRNGDYTRIPLSGAAEMPFSAAGTRVTIAGTTYYASTIDSLTFTAPELDVKDKVVVRYQGGTATVSVPSGVQGVTYKVDGAHVALTSTNVTDELEYVLQGQSSAGSLTYTGSYKCKFYLNGLNLTSNKGAAVDIQCGKRIELVLNEGSTNVLCDAPGGEQKAALYCKGHLEIGGFGTLILTGRTKHALATKEYLQLKRTTGAVIVVAAESDGFHCGQYFQMNGGTVKIDNVKGDGIQAEETKDPLDENNGEMIIKGGRLELDIPGDDVKGLKCDQNMTISGGQIDITVSGAGSKGIGVDGNLVINEDNNPTDINVLATGGVYTDPILLTTSKCMGIKVDLDLTVSAGRITVKNTGDKSRGIKVDGTYYARGGTVNATVDAAATSK